MAKDDVNVIFGCSSSSGRKAVMPVVERNNGLLWCCSFYEGFALFMEKPGLGRSS